MVKSRTIIATPPGATIKEQLVERGMSQKEFASRMAMSEKHISKLINGEVLLSPEMAVRLEMVLGVPAKFWNNLEAIYREKLVKANAENEMDEDKEILKMLPVKEMVQNGWIESAARSEDRVIVLRKYFEVVTLSLINHNGITKIACRRMGGAEKADYALLAWAQRAKLEARGRMTQPINLKALSESLPFIRAMTTMDPALFCPRLINTLADCGIALVFLPHIGGSFLHGASFLDGSKIVIGLTVRGKDADKFWFSLFHELGHVLLGHISKADGTTDEDEIAADQFARDILIPPVAYSEFLKTGCFTKSSVKDFAKMVGIDVGVVVGRLQKDGTLEYSRYNDMKTKYIISS